MQILSRHFLQKPAYTHKYLYHICMHVCINLLHISSYICSVSCCCHPRNTLIQNICWQCAVFIGFSLMRVCPPRLGSVCGVVSPKCRLDFYILLHASPAGIPTIFIAIVYALSWRHDFFTLALVFNAILNFETTTQNGTEHILKFEVILLTFSPCMHRLLCPDEFV